MANNSPKSSSKRKNADSKRHTPPRTRSQNKNKKPKFLDEDAAAVAISKERKKNLKRKREPEDKPKKTKPSKNSKKTKIPAKKSNSSKKLKAEFTLPNSRNYKKDVPWETNTDLNVEIASFADYVRLDETESALRDEFVSVIQQVVRKLYPKADLSIFGSFATPQVCNFTSDVDITISNAIDMPMPIAMPIKAKEERAPVSFSREKKTEVLKKKWLSALQQVDASNEASQGSSGSDDSDPFVITPSDNDDSDDTADPLKRDRSDSIDSTNLTVSIGATRTHVNKCTARCRRQIQECLAALRRRLYNVKSIQRIQFIANARVPILKIRTSFSMEADICLQEGQMTDTRLFASECVEMYGDKFSDVVLILKVLLNQQGLDVPFAGGLGSYKLYALLARHLSIQGRSKSTSTDDMAGILSTFFASFSHYKRIVYKFDLVHAEETEVDLTNVTRLKDIAQFFRACRERLLAHKHLACIVDVNRLELERERLRKLCDKKVMAADVKKWCSNTGVPTLDQPLTVAR